MVDMTIETKLLESVDKRVDSHVKDLKSDISEKLETECSKCNLIIHGIVEAQDVADETAVASILDSARHLANVMSWQKSGGQFPIWNSLPNDVVMADNTNLFKNHLDKFWSSCKFFYSYLELNHLEPEV